MLLPEFLDDWLSKENPVWAIAVFVDELDLGVLGFEGVESGPTPRPAGLPSGTAAEALRLHGYFNQVASRGRLEREAGRNIELMWLTGRLAPDLKTIADFRKDNGPAIRAACRGAVPPGGPLHRAGSGDRWLEVQGGERAGPRVEASIARYLAARETADRREGGLATGKTERLAQGIALLREQMTDFQTLAPVRDTQPDRQLSLADPDARSMATNGRGSGIVGYNVQAAADAGHHLIVSHEVTNVGHDCGAGSHGRRRRRWASRRWRYWPTAAASMARRCWPARLRA